jgi:hypothetical protein
VQRRQRPRWSSAWRLDPDHVRAEVREEAAAHLAFALGHVDHSNAVEWSGSFLHRGH